tara:strand:- start:3443 stop:4594 length:1152 start_codon:yes stop_codon:yes gene_type:complete
MLTKNINFINFQNKKKSKSILNSLKLILSGNNEIILSLKKNYKNSYGKKILKLFKNKNDYRIVGMGGSILGANAIYDFLNDKIKKKFYFINNLQANHSKLFKKNYNNLIISKSGNTLETIVNFNILVKKKDKNLFITEDKNSYLKKIANELKSEVISHNNYIGGRYSVLSEVGMLPAELMGLNTKDFKQLNQIIKNKKFLDNLVMNVNSILIFIKQKKFNSIIINYDEKSTNLFNWYQQLVAESLGKKKNGLLPVVSTMPKDNHSVMQLYLDGFKNNFFTFFYVNEKKSLKTNKNFFKITEELMNKNLNEIIFAQKKATENVFRRKKIPFRSFEINKRDEKTLGELFTFFILETILIGKALKLNPFDQPAVELIKKETKKILI